MNVPQVQKTHLDQAKWDALHAAHLQALQKKSCELEAWKQQAGLNGQKAHTRGLALDVAGDVISAQDVELNTLKASQILPYSMVQYRSACPKQPCPISAHTQKQ